MAAFGGCMNMEDGKGGGRRGGEGGREGGMDGCTDIYRILKRTTTTLKTTKK
jgi:hypothetical protein